MFLQGLRVGHGELLEAPDGSIFVCGCRLELIILTMIVMCVILPLIIMILMIMFAK